MLTEILGIILFLAVILLPFLLMATCNGNNIIAEERTFTIRLFKAYAILGVIFVIVCLLRYYGVD